MAQWCRFGRFRAMSGDGVMFTCTRSMCIDGLCPGCTVVKITVMDTKHMSLATTIEQIITEEVKTGRAQTECEAEQAILDAIEERETQRAIAQGETEIEAGLGIPIG